MAAGVLDALRRIRAIPLRWAKGNGEILRGILGAWAILFVTLSALGSLIERDGQLLKHRLGLNVTLLECGPLGRDQQIGSRISEGQIDFLIFFSDPLEAQPHDCDVKALLRITVVWKIPVACNRASADFLISSPLMSTGYERVVPDYSIYGDRLLVGSHFEPTGRGSEGRRGHRGFALAGDTPLQITTAIGAGQ
jgi:methylglyoxal synthase